MALKVRAKESLIKIGKYADTYRSQKVQLGSVSTIVLFCLII